MASWRQINPGLLSLHDQFALTDPPADLNKVMSLHDAVQRFIAPGTALHVAYSDARPNAVLLEILRQFDGKSPGFTVSTAGLVSVQHALIGRGLVRRVMVSFSGDNYPAPAPNAVFQSAVASGLVEVENWSMYGLVARLMAGALGVPFFPVRSIAGSDMEAEHLGTSFAFVRSELADEPVGVVRSYRPDVTVLQGVAADRSGNVVLAAPYGEALWGSLAAKRGVIACVERIVEPSALRACNNLVMVPGHVVAAVCPVPFGSHPYGLYNPGVDGVSSYALDHDFLVDVQRRSRQPAEFDAWIDEWVMGTADHAAYLEKLGGNRLSRLRGDADPAAWEFDSAPETAGGPTTAAERMVVAAAEILADNVRDEGYQAILAGVGFANLAAWLARRVLEGEGRTVSLMAEIGMFGYDPRPGDPFIFSIRNVPTCTQLSDVVGVLGTFVSGPATKAIGSLGAAEIDQYGNLNSTWARDGRYLVGSGGANDIASGADEVIVTIKHDVERLVDRVAYVTCPGHRVRTIVTTEGILARRGEGFELVAYFDDPGATARQHVDRIRSRTGWDLAVSDSLRAVSAPSPDRVELIRRFDPRRTFLR